MLLVTHSLTHSHTWRQKNSQEHRRNADRNRNLTRSQSLLPASGTNYHTSSRLHHHYGFSTRLILSIAPSLNMCSACEVTFVIFGHFNCFRYKLTQKNSNYNTGNSLCNLALESSTPPKKALCGPMPGELPTELVHVGPAGPFPLMLSC